MVWLKIDIGLPHILQHRDRTILPRGPRLDRQMAVSNGCVRYPDAHVEDYPYPSIPDGPVVAVPPVLLESCHDDTICNPFKEMWRWLKWMSKGASQRWCCESDALQCCQGIPRDDRGMSHEDLGDGVNGGARQTRALRVLYRGQLET